MKNKTLIISSYAPPAIGGPQILYNLLKDVPSESYSILTSFNNIDNISAKKGTWLSGEYIFYDAVGKTRESFDQRTGETKSRSFVSNLKHLMKRSSFFKVIFGFPVIAGQVYMITKVGLKTVRKGETRKILSVSDYGPALISSYFISKKKKTPLVLFLFDLYKGNDFPFPGNILSSIFEPKLFETAEKIIVTNEGTKDFYIKRYGETVREKIEIIHNSTFPDQYLELHSPYDPKPPYSILFTGRVYWPQIGSIKNLIKAVEEIDLPVELKIYSPSPREYLDTIGIRETKKVKLFDPVSPTEIAKIQTKADILFLPLSWNTKSPEIIDTATPGKLTDYLVSGRPMLIHAPSSSFLVKYAKENEFAFVADSNNIEGLKIGISRLATDIEYSKELIKNAKETFFRNHDVKANSLKMKEIIFRE